MKKSVKKKEEMYPEDLPGYSEYLAKNLARLFKKEIKKNPSGSLLEYNNNVK